MFEKFSYTLSVMRACWNVLRRTPGLLILPLLSAIACGLVVASFAVPFILTMGHHSGAGAPGHHNQNDPLFSVLHYVLLFAFYFCNYFVITFFNSALVACAVASLRGEPTNVGYGLGEAFSRIHLIAGWALLSATVGVILRAIEDRADFLGQIVASLLGLAWGVASYLVVPVLVIDNLGPFAALKRSSAMLRKTWGESLVGSFGFGSIFALLMLPAIAFVVVGFMLSTGHGFVPLFVGAGLAVAYVIVLSLVQSTLGTIFQAAVYLYASEPGLLQAADRRGQGFPVTLLSNAMVAKR